MRPEFLQDEIHRRQRAQYQPAYTVKRYKRESKAKVAALLMLVAVITGYCSWRMLGG